MSDDLQALEKRIAELTDANARLEKSLSARVAFLRTMSHEFATPMTPILGYVRLLLDEQLGPLSAMQKKSIESIGQSAERLRALVETLLDVSSLEAGHMRFFSQPADLVLILEGSIKTATKKAKEIGVNVAFSKLAVAAPSRIDKAKLGRAFDALLDNAVKFSPRGSTIGVQLSRHDTMDGEGYLVDIADDGPGIAPEDRKRVFEPFVQVDASPTRVHGGAGLGLAFARRVVEGQGGSISLESPPPSEVAGRLFRGTLVRVFIPEARAK